MSSHTGSTESAETALQRANTQVEIKKKKKKGRRKISFNIHTELLICTAADDAIIACATFHDMIMCGRADLF